MPKSELVYGILDGRFAYKICFVNAPSYIDPIGYRWLTGSNRGPSGAEVVEGETSGHVLPGRFMIARGCAGHWGMTLPMWCRVCVWIVYRGSIRRFLIVPIVYRGLDSFLSGVVEEGWDLARSMLAGFKWVRAESDWAANQVR
ncbi:hypothetical protein ACHAQJ_002107 [Trichoderma viride]